MPSLCMTWMLRPLCLESQERNAQTPAMIDHWFLGGDTAPRPQAAPFALGAVKSVPCRPTVRGNCSRRKRPPRSTWPSTSRSPSAPVNRTRKDRAHLQAKPHTATAKDILGCQRSQGCGARAHLVRGKRTSAQQHCASCLFPTELSSSNSPTSDRCGASQ